MRAQQRAVRSPLQTLTERELEVLHDRGLDRRVAAVLRYVTHAGGGKAS